VDDGPSSLGDQIHHFGDCRGVVVAGQDDGSWPDERRLPSLVEEGPDVPTLVLVVQVGRIVGEERLRICGRDPASVDAGRPT